MGMGKSEMPSEALPDPEQSRWRNLVGRIRGLQIELRRTGKGQAFGLAGNPGAPASALRIAEMRLALKLPPSYRQFLLFSDGWPSFFEGADLLGTADVGRPSCLDPALQAQGTQPNPLLSIPGYEHLLPFGASKDGKTLFAFDTRPPRAQGEMPVVAWIGGLGLKLPNFTEFLALVLQLCRTQSAALLQEAVDVEVTLNQQRPIRSRRRPNRSGTTPIPSRWRSVG